MLHCHFALHLGTIHNCFIDVKRERMMLSCFGSDILCLWQPFHDLSGQFHSPGKFAGILFVVFGKGLSKERTLQDYSRLNPIVINN